MFSGCRKRSALETQFHLIVVSIFLKTCVEVHGDLALADCKKEGFDYCFEALLVAVL